MSTAFSIAFWLKAAVGSGTTQYYYGEGLSSDGTAFFGINDAGGTDGHLQAIVRNDAGSFRFAQSSANVQIDGTWHHFIYAQDASNNVAFYTDGGSKETFSYTDGGSTLTFDKATLGALVRTSAGNWAACTFAHFAMFDRMLTDKEAASLGAGLLPSHLGPKHYWPLWGVDSPEPDLGTSTHVTGTLTGTSLGAGGSPAGLSLVRIRSAGVYPQATSTGPQTIAGSTGIASAGAFGANGVMTFAQAAVGSVGITSREAFGVGGAAVYPQQATGTDGIPSGEAFSSGAVTGEVFGSLPVESEDCDLVLAPYVADTQEITTIGSLNFTSIASGSGSGTTLVLTLTEDVPGDGLLMAFSGSVSLDTAFNDIGLVVSSVSDSAGGTWSLGSPNFVVGSISVGWGELGHTNELAFGESAVREVSAGELSAGDTLTLTFQSDYPSSVSTIAVLAFVSGAALRAVNGDGVGEPLYGFGEWYPGGGPDTTDTTLVFQTGHVIETFVDACGVLAVSLTYPPSSGYVPAQGSKLTEFSSDEMSLAVSYIPSIPALDDTYEPGGTWSTSCDAIVGNYQGFSFTEVTTIIDGCDLDLEPEVEDCDLSLVPFAPRVIGTQGATGRLIVGTAGIASEEAFGAGAALSVLGGGGQDGLGTAGIVSEEAFGTTGIISAGVTRIIGSHGISPGAGTGSGGFVSGGGVLYLTSGGGIASAETFGANGKITMKISGTTGIVSRGAFGSTGILHFTTGIKGTSGITSGGAFGTNGKMLVTIKGVAGIVSPQSGNRFLSLSQGTTQVGQTATAEIEYAGFGTNGSIS